ncbi:MAG: GTP 3',8-cyclase MoaA [Selenomonadaceae bacterium]|nr:GTP 3',8-cyclase MoaA [Selenomonadaceae bacterium]
MIDQYGRKIEYVRISLTDRCNLRCQYCMPECGIEKISHDDILSLEEVLHVVKLLADCGIRKVRLTGGEPLLRRGIVDLIREIKAIENIEQIFLTTNGVLLSNMADDLINAGVNGFNISLDTLNEKTFEKITRRNLFKKVFESIQKLIDSGVEIKLNCVPIAGVNEEDILKIVELARDNFIKVRFIELMPIGCAVDFKGIPIGEVKSKIESIYGKLISHSAFIIPNYQGPAKYFTLNGFKGQIGFIDAIDHKFCNSCNRIRLTANGFLKLCLNSNAGLDIKSLLRSNADDQKIFEAIKQAIYNKPKEHHFNVECRMQNAKLNFNAMYQIGG